METVIVISTNQVNNNATPTFVAPLETVRVVVGMETIVSYNISDNTAMGLSVVPVTVLPLGVAILPVVQLSDSIGMCMCVCLSMRLCPIVCACVIGYLIGASLSEPHTSEKLGIVVTYTNSYEKK